MSSFILFRKRLTLNVGTKNIQESETVIIISICLSLSILKTDFTKRPLCRDAVMYVLLNVQRRSEIRFDYRRKMFGEFNLYVCLCV